jgi:tetratricopeptide (TPR) repeat protein
MKRMLYVALVLSMAMLTACAAPAASQTSEITTATATAIPTTPSLTTTRAASSPEAVVEGASTIDELNALMKQYYQDGNYAAALLCADKMLKVDPAYGKAYYAQAEYRVLLLEAEYKELNDMLAKGMETVDDPAEYTEVIKHLLEGRDLTVKIPFRSDYTSKDEVNTNGISCANYANQAVYMQWQGGLLTSQGDWVYYSVPAEGYALYKMRMNGEDKQRLGSDTGCYLNVIGDWIYYCNLSKENAIFKMRTDGSEGTPITDDKCTSMAVCGEWMIYCSKNEDERLYKMRLDGSERTMLCDRPVKTPYLMGDTVYFGLRDENAFCSVGLEGGKAKKLVDQRINYYCFDGDWIYYMADNKGLVIEKMRLDGSEKTEVFRFFGKANGLNITEGRLVLEGCLKDGAEEQIGILDLATMEFKLVVDEWCSTYIAGDRGYYIDYEDNNAWYSFSLVSGEITKLS